ncbi:hypothetical protein RA307_16580 [Xanthobacteraceae bacterium Astr-EGSB]|uniref:hypothetical protein n=1 Tax=Astrobacterium formosum TaxID=3069710 RepID=UPI0027B4E8B3|nr:hypothetical protein [Xanthobacteraceae bacterium Astr-EGSB]
MGHVTSYLLGGFAAVSSWAMVAPGDSATPSFVDIFRAPDQAASETVMRAAKGDRKGDRLPPAVSQQALPDVGVRRIVTSIEVVGIDDASILYRDRDGNILYRTDPVRNVTVIAKGVKLPEVTVRQGDRSPTTPVPMTVPDAGKPAKLPVGCEPAASPIASPHLSHLTGLCLAALDTDALAPR